MNLFLKILAVILFFEVQLDIIGKELSLNQALDTAIANNHTVRSQELIAEYKSILKASGYTIEQAVLSVDYGQINSAFNDLKVNLSQRYEFPTVYAKQQALLHQEWNAAVLSTHQSIAELKKNVREIYYGLLLLQSREKMLKEADSIYGEYVKISDIRLKQGESNILEHAHHKIEQSAIQIQLQSVHSTLNIVKIQFQLLLNSAEAHVPEKEALNMRFSSDNAYNPQMHPYIQQVKQSIEIAKAKQALEEARYLPDLHLGISNQSIQGIGADNILYPMSRRFTSFTVGVGIPHPFGAQQAIIEASKTSVKISETEYEFQVKKISSELKAAKIARDSTLQTVRNIELHQLPLIKSVREAAEIQYKTGEISYLEWTLAMHHTITIQSQYYDVLQQYYDLSNTVTYLEEQ